MPSAAALTNSCVARNNWKRSEAGLPVSGRVSTRPRMSASLRSIANDAAGMQARSAFAGTLVAGTVLLMFAGTAAASMSAPGRDCLAVPWQSLRCDSPVPCLPAPRLHRQTRCSGMAATAGAFLLPGAAAAKGKGHGAGTGPKPAGAASPPAKNAARSATRLGSRKKDARNPLAPEDQTAHQRGNPASRNPASMAGAASAKESMVNPMKVSGKKSEPDDGSRDPQVRQHGPTLIAGRAAARTPQLADSAESDEVSWPSSPVSQTQDRMGVLPVCFGFDDARVAALQTRHNRYGQRPLHFCVRAVEQGAFRDFFERPANAWHSMGTWMACKVIDNPVPPELRRLLVQRDGAYDPADAMAPDAAPLEGERVFAVLTISLLDDALRREAGSRVLRRIAPNTFRIMHYHGWGGVDRWVMAYSLQRGPGACGGVKAGFLDLDVARSEGDGPGRWAVHVAQRNETLVAPDIGTFTRQIEQLTGLRYQGRGARQGPASASPEPATHLFVELDPTASDHPSYNDGLEPLVPIMLDVQGWPDPVPLYYNSARWVNEMLVIADGKGRDGSPRSGQISFGAHALPGGARQLMTPDSADMLAMIHEAGLNVGVFYTQQQVSEQLQDNLGMIMLPKLTRPEGVGMRPCGGGGGGHPTQPLQRSGDSSGSSTARFHWNDGLLLYVDEHGHAGQAQFDRVDDYPKQRWQLSASVDVLPRLFLELRGLLPDLDYSLQELEWMLRGSGLVPMAEAPEGMDVLTATARPSDGSPED